MAGQGRRMGLKKTPRARQERALGRCKDGKPLQRTMVWKSGDFSRLLNSVLLLANAMVN
jgi:hypothetical protein